MFTLKSLLQSLKNLLGANAPSVWATVPIYMSSPIAIIAFVRIASSRVCRNATTNVQYVGFTFRHINRSCLEEPHFNRIYMFFLLDHVSYKKLTTDFLALRSSDSTFKERIHISLGEAIE